MSFTRTVRVASTSTVSSRDAVNVLDLRRNSTLRGASARGRVVDLRVAEDGTLLAIDQDSWARLSDPSSEAGAVALARSSPALPRFTRLRGPSHAADAFIAALPDPSAWSRMVENYEMVLTAPPALRADSLTAAPHVKGSLRVATELEDSFDQWREAFTRECFPEGMTPPPVARDQLFVWVDGAPRSMAGLLSIGDGAMRVVTVYTPPHDRGRGYAGALVAAIGEHTQRLGVPVVSLDVDRMNVSAQRAYARAGFRIVGGASIWYVP